MDNISALSSDETLWDVKVEFGSAGDVGFDCTTVLETVKSVCIAVSNGLMLEKPGSDCDIRPDPQIVKSITNAIYSVAR